MTIEEERNTQQAAETIFAKWDKNIIFANRKWYLFNEPNGIYNEIDEILLTLEIEKTVEVLKEYCNEPWLEWTCDIDYKQQLIEELLPRCYAKVIFDSDPELLGFSNGVLDLRTFEFRNGRKEDYITMKCGHKYDETVSVDLAQRLLENLFPIHEEYDSMLNSLSLCLEGTNRTQEFVACTGLSYEKYFLMERLYNIFNNYSNIFSIKTIKNSREDEDTIDLMKFNNKRFMYCYESEDDDKINTSFLKALTSDEIPVKGNHQMNPTYNLFICCENLLDFDITDNGIKRRLKTIEFQEKLYTKFQEEDMCEVEQSLLNLMINNLRNNIC